MSALFKRVGTLVVVLDLVVAAAASAGVLHHHGAASAGSVAAGPKLSGAQLEQIVAATSGRTSCSSDPTGGWDYYCISGDGSRALYDVSADGVTQRSDLPSYR